MAGEEKTAKPDKVYHDWKRWVTSITVIQPVYHPSRIAMFRHTNGLYSTHVECLPVDGCNDNTPYLCWGHYDLSLEEGMDDFHLRLKNLDPEKMFYESPE